MLKASILITSYNAEKTIKKSLKSALNQNFKKFEIVVVDDGSTDRTKKIIKSLKLNLLKVFYLKKNIGRTKALNYGLKKCKGKYIAILDADDISSPSRISLQYEYLENNKDKDLVASYFYKINKNTAIKKVSYNSIKEFYNVLPILNIVAHSTTMYRKNILKNIIFIMKTIYTLKIMR